MIMIEIVEMRKDEMSELLKQLGYGHLGCSRNDQAYVVPVHFAYDEPLVYIYTTEGKKTEIIRANPKVCLQAETVVDTHNWKSVIVTGDAEQVADAAERDKALTMLTKRNPTMTPAVSLRWMDNWVRENIEAILRITPRMMTGRATVPQSEIDAPFAPDPSRRTTIF
jgi:nitroimidazol reductase NimA-like FMN-containing flavoprotein (pyridoxamine 5'-phosphate oxidase superfamily)